MKNRITREEGLAHVLTKVFEESREGIVITDSKANILAVNKGHEALTGYSREELIGQNPRMMKSEVHDAVFYRQMWDELIEKGRWQGEIWDRRKDGQSFCKTLSISSAEVGESKEVYYLGIFSDITEKKLSETRLEQLAHYDQLTNLPNRILFLDRLKQAIWAAERSGKQVAVLFMDLDGFKRVNDTLGHRAGDHLLMEVARRFEETVRDSDTVGRMGGDEFTVVLPAIKQVTDCIVVARKLLGCLKDPFQIEKREIFITTSVGISTYPFDGGVDELIKNADTAMYEAKRRGKNRYQFYSAEMNKSSLHKLELETELRKALERNELLLHYQPQLDIATNQIVSVEALLRWQHPEKGLIPPDEFITIAEESDFIGDVGEWALTEACQAAERWNQSLSPPVKVWVNVAGQQLALDNLIAVVKRALKSASLNTAHLGLELTERSVMADMKAVTLMLETLRGLGIEISIDDFGTGYSSLAYLSRFPLNHLKIPKEFIDGVGTESDGHVITEAILAMAGSLGLLVVAEGVETEEQFEVLKEKGCDIVQGYLLSRPLEEADLVKFIQERRRSIQPPSRHVITGTPKPPPGDKDR